MATSTCDVPLAVIINYLYLFSSSVAFFQSPSQRTVVMATPTRDYRYSVEFNVHAIDAPGTRLIKQGDIYINICLLGMHKQTRLMPPYLPMHLDQKLYFDKVNLSKKKYFEKQN